MSAYIRISFCCFFAFSLCCSFALGTQNQNLKNPPETVCVGVSVSDPLNRIVTGLTIEHFRIYEDNTEQTIASISQKPAPMSIGIIWDVSRNGNGGGNFEIAKATVSKLLFPRAPNLEFERAENEYFLINFSESAPIQRISHEMLPIEVLIDKGNKRIPLFDSIYIGLYRLHQSKHDLRVLIVISDGVETDGLHNKSEIDEYARESDFRIYTIMKNDQAKQESFLSRIRNIVDITGGRAFFPNSFNELDYYIDLIHTVLRSQYLLCYVPTNNKHDGTSRKIKIKLEKPPKLPLLNIHAREERYAPKE